MSFLQRRLGPPPTSSPIGDENANSMWKQWFSKLYNWTDTQSLDWVPTVTGVTPTAGSLTVNGAWFRSGALVYIQVSILPAQFQTFTTLAPTITLPMPIAPGATLASLHYKLLGGVILTGTAEGWANVSPTVPINTAQAGNLSSSGAGIALQFDGIYVTSA